MYFRFRDFRAELSVSFILHVFHLKTGRLVLRDHYHPPPHHHSDSGPVKTFTNGHSPATITDCYLTWDIYLVKSSQRLFH